MDSHEILKHTRSEKVALLAMFVALGAVFKISLAALPNVELLTFWVFVVTVVYGLKVGITVGVLANAVADLYIGAGPWTPFTSIGFGIVAVIVYLYKRAGCRSQRDYLYCAILATVAFDVFTVITTSWLLFGVPLLPALYMQYGILPPTFYPFGIVHLVANGILFSLFGEKIVAILRSLG
ncbi:MAG: ECF transporter S component [Euryarchaeota archaeon]|nr:ECF transporter S component [Euryarchaeota archaeon]